MERAVEKAYRQVCKRYGFDAGKQGCLHSIFWRKYLDGIIENLCFYEYVIIWAKAYPRMTFAEFLDNWYKIELVEAGREYW